MSARERGTRTEKEKEFHVCVRVWRWKRKSCVCPNLLKINKESRWKESLKERTGGLDPSPQGDYVRMTLSIEQVEMWSDVCYTAPDKNINWRHRGPGTVSWIIHLSWVMLKQFIPLLTHVIRSGTYESRRFSVSMLFK